MQRKTVCTDGRLGVKRPVVRPVELTAFEMERLIGAFIKGKTEVDEADCMTLVKWAMTQRFGAMIVDLMIAGDIRPVVKDGEVLVEAMS